MHKSRIAEIVGKTQSPVLYGKNRSFKRQNTIPLKTGGFIKVSELLRFALVLIFSARESFVWQYASSRSQA